MSDWLKKANRFLGDIAGQAGRQAEIVKLQAKLGSLENDLEQVYVEAGKRAEELLKSRQIHDNELAVILERARKINEEMMQVRERVQELRSASEDEAAAGAREPQQGPDAPEQPQPSHEGEEAAGSDQQQRQAHCPSCGEKVGQDAAFCSKCGEKLQVQDQ
ncbi:MAG: zinc ribbon domain-containing protein [Armatimonadota bacterium]